MKLKKLLFVGGVILASYTVGRIVGHMECLSNVVEKHGDCLFKDADTFTDQIGKLTYITVTKPAEKETEECNA